MVADKVDLMWMPGKMSDWSVPRRHDPIVDSVLRLDDSHNGAADADAAAAAIAAIVDNKFERCTRHYQHLLTVIRGQSHRYLLAGVTSRLHHCICGSHVGNTHCDVGHAEGDVIDPSIRSLTLRRSSTVTASACVQTALAESKYSL